MIAFIIAATLLSVIAMQLHTTVLYSILFLCGAIVLPALAAIQLTALVLAAWGVIELALHIRTQFNGVKFYWKAGNFQLAVVM